MAHLPYKKAAAWTPTPQNTATNPSERISRFPLGSTPLPKPKGSMSLKFCSKHSPRSTKRKPLWFELIQGCRNSRPPFQNHSPESGYRFVITKGHHDSLPPSLHHPKLDNKTLLSFSHTKKHLAHLQSAFFFFPQRLTMSPASPRYKKAPVRPKRCGASL